jgi:pyridoxamine 5'-phosphate oxidase
LRPENPLDLFTEWFHEARDRGIADPNALALATADASGMPAVRMVLLKQFDDDGFVFYTNLASSKARDLQDNPRASMCFHWRELKKQIRVSGAVVPVSKEEADQYFASRPRNSQIGAWASKQSQKMAEAHELEKRVAKFLLKFNVGEVPRPDFWSGFRLVPQRIEFWADRAFRLHERFAYDRVDGKWVVSDLFP